MVIVESPAKAKTISRYLGRDFQVKASVGHIKDLPKNKLGVDIDNNFTPEFKVIPGKEKVIRELKKAAKSAEKIYLAADPDREGEAICFHIASEINGKKLYRIMFNEITERAIKEAVKNPGEINENLVHAQFARRILDRIVGYKVSPLLWEKVRRGLSAGRVQTVALRLIVEREKEIRDFKPEEYWTFVANLIKGENIRIKARAYKFENGKKFKVNNEVEAKKIEERVKKSEFIVISTKSRKVKEKPLPPFITSKLQQEAFNRFKFTAKKTMQIAQRLYEGIEIGEQGRIGLITYMRTDSTRISNEALSSVRKFIEENIGKNYLPQKANVYKKSNAAQDAHEAIRPTNVYLKPNEIKNFLSNDEFKLYELIWKRFVASQMKPAEFSVTEYEIKSSDVIFLSKGKVLLFDGFLKVYKNISKNEEENTLLPELKEGDVLALESLEVNQKFTQPPLRYTEASLIRTLEEKGIGRPSTYATIVSTIQNRDYVIKEEGRFKPTPIGELVVELLLKSFSDIFDYKYTAKMEEDLDRIERGEIDWITQLKKFYENFSTLLKKAKVEMKDIKKEVEYTDEICDKCGGRMVIKWGRFGRFLACENYPECKNTKELNGNEAEDENLTCPKCGKKLVLKSGRFGKFYACSGYPDCKYTMPIKNGKVKEDRVLDEKCPICGSNLVEKHGRFGKFIACSNYPECNFVKKDTIGVKCPVEGCDGEIIRRRSKRGKIFYGCSNYPKCNFISWDKPINRKCPECGSPYLLEKVNKKVVKIYCPNENCDFEEIEEKS